MAGNQQARSTCELTDDQLTKVVRTDTKYMPGHNGGRLNYFNSVLNYYAPETDDIEKINE